MEPCEGNLQEQHLTKSRAFIFGWKNRNCQFRFWACNRFRKNFQRIREQDCTRRGSFPIQLQKIRRRRKTSDLFTDRWVVHQSDPSKETGGGSLKIREQREDKGFGKR